MADEQIERLLYSRWRLKMREQCQRKQKKKEDDKRKQLRDLFFVEYRLCNVHRNEGCPKCWIYGLGICPPIKEL